MQSNDQTLRYSEIIAENARLSAEVSHLKQELALLRRLLFGPKRERYVPVENPQQLSIPLGLAPAAEHEQISYTRRKAQKKQPPHSPAKRSSLSRPKMSAD